MNTYTTHQMHMNIKVDPVTHYTFTFRLQEQNKTKQKRCDDKVNSRFLPFAQVWSQIPSNTQQLVVHKIRIQN